MGKPCDHEKALGSPSQDPRRSEILLNRKEETATKLTTPWKAFSLNLSQSADNKPLHELLAERPTASQTVGRAWASSCQGHLLVLTPQTAVMMATELPPFSVAPRVSADQSGDLP
jgi:hypothetical protein